MEKSNTEKIRGGEKRERWGERIERGGERREGGEEAGGGGRQRGRRRKRKRRRRKNEKRSNKMPSKSRHLSCFDFPVSPPLLPHAIFLFLFNLIQRELPGKKEPQLGNASIRLAAGFDMKGPT